jgi:COP9 signalosome complex subunit 1
LLAQVKAGQNVTLYKEVVEMIGDKMGSAFDTQWVERTQEQNDKQMDKLEVDLCQHKLNSIKEKVRMGHNDLGNHHYAVGNLNEALKSFMRTRDYGTTTKHTLDMCLSIIRVSIEMGNFTHVLNYVTKAEAQPEQPTDLSVVAKLRAAAGLAHLDGGKYKQAALKFTQMKNEVGKGENNQPMIKNIHPDELCYNEVLAPQDVAIYGGLCALATFDRPELASKVPFTPSPFPLPLESSNRHRPYTVR